MRAVLLIFLRGEGYSRQEREALEKLVLILKRSNLRLLTFYSDFLSLFCDWEGKRCLD
jgi:hypothetical protein